MFDAVGEFRAKMQLPMSNSPHLLSPEETSYFARFIMEELSEYLRANEEQNLVGAADAIVDLVYVALGAAHAMGLPFNELFKVVHKANLKKEPANEFCRSIRGNQYDVIKPVGWEAPEPEMENIINKAIKDVK